MAERAANALQWCGIRPGTRALPEERATPAEAEHFVAMQQATEALMRHYEAIESLQMRDMFATDPQRFDRFSLELGDLLFDYSKNRIIDETITLLCELAGAAELQEWRRLMFRGDKINNTEQRAVLHTALRNRSGIPVRVDGKDVMPEVNRVLEKMRHFTDKVRSGDSMSEQLNSGIRLRKVFLQIFNQIDNL